MSNILTRTIYGALFVAIVLGAFLLGGYFALVVLGVFMLIGLHEFFRFFDNVKDINPSKTIGFLGGTILFTALALPYFFDYQLSLYLVIIPVFFLSLLYIVYSKKENPLLDIAITLFSWIYIVFPFYLMFAIYSFRVEGQANWIFVIGFFVLVWANDTFAYLSGRAFGKHKLFERISPKKTWQGAIGGFICTILFAGAFAYLFDTSVVFWMIAAMIISPMSVFGDLIESRFKRIVNVKDSGTLVPGHGGVLDRFDASMFAAPFFYLLLIIFFT